MDAVIYQRKCFEVLLTAAEIGDYQVRCTKSPEKNPQSSNGTCKRSSLSQQEMRTTANTFQQNIHEIRLMELIY